MRKIYSLFLVLLMLPMLAVAQMNMAIGKTHNGANYRDRDPQNKETRVLIPFSAVNFTQPTPETGKDFSVGMWFKTTGIYRYNNPKVGVLLRLGTGNHMNANGSLWIHQHLDGELKICMNADNIGGFTGYSWSTTQANCGKSLGNAPFNEWHYLLLVFDSSNHTITAYLDGTQTFQDTNAPAIGYKWDDGVFQAICQSYSGQLDEFQLFDAVLTPEQAATAYINAKGIAGLSALFTFDELKEGTGGQFPSVAGSVTDAVATYQNCTYSNYWAEGLANLSDATETDATFFMGREIPVTEATITIQQPTEGGTFTVNDGTTDHSETFTTNTGTELTLNATPDAGYNLVGFYTVDGETETKLEGNTFTPAGDATLTARFTAETYALTVANEQQIPYTLTYNGAEVTDLAALLGGGAEYVLTLTVPDDKVLNAVRLGETVLTPNTDGQYTFTMSADATLTIDARAKSQYVVTINQPTSGGTISASNNGVDIVSGEEVLEGTVLTLSNTPEIGYLFTNYTVDGNAIEGNSVTVNSPVTISGEFGEGVDYCIPEGRATRIDRGITSLTVTESGTGTTVTVTGTGTTYGRKLYNDQTGTIVTTTAGATITIKDNGIGTWMSNYVYIDYNKNGVFEFDPAACAGANVDGELVSHTGFSNNASNPTVASDGSTIDWQKSYECTLPTIQLPEDIAPGDYRIRHKLDWNCADPCGRLSENGYNGDYMDANGGGVIDFTIRIESNEYDAPRTITVASSNEALGTVAITSPATDEKSISTPQKAVIIKATPVETATFKNWTNADGEVVSTEATYSYTGETDITLTANFGHMLNVEVATGGAIESIVNAETGEAIANHSVVDPDTHIKVTVTPPEKKITVVSVNGGAGIACEQNLYEFRINENSDVNFSFDDKILNLTLNVAGDGSVECWSAASDDFYTPMGTQLHTGDRIINGTDIHFWAKPAEGKDLTAVSLTMGGETFDLSFDNEDYWLLDDESGRYYMPWAVEDSVEITFTFSDSAQAIDEIGIDPANGPVEYYNLQGVRVDAENLAPGFYIVRQGSNAKKVFIRK